MGYICLEACTMGGNKYIAGDTIPDEFVIPQRVSALVDMGLIAPNNTDNTTVTETLEAEERANDTMFVTLLGKKDEQDVAVEVAVEDVAKVFIALQLNAETAAEFVRENIDSTEALEVLGKLDQRKTVKNVIAEKTAAEKTAGEE